MPYSYAWSADFTQPDPLTGLAVTADDVLISLDVECDPSEDTYHYEYLWEAQVGDGEWTEIGRSSDETFTYYLAPMNTDVRIRVSDSNGSQYSDTIETVGSLTFERWAMTHVDGNDDFITELRYVQQEPLDIPLDQVVLQPLSGADGDTQPPIIFTGQWQGERIGFQLEVVPEDRGLIALLKRAALEPQGKIALKDPLGPVYIVQLGGFQVGDRTAGHQLLAFTAIRVA